MSSLVIQGPLLSVPENFSTWRILLDLSTLNKFTVCPHFKMTTISEVQVILSKNTLTTFIDLMDAYWHVPITLFFQQYLEFKVSNQKFRFWCLPFGLNTAPLGITKLTVQVILRELNLKGIQSVTYLDNWSVWTKSEKE